MVDRELSEVRPGFNLLARREVVDVYGEIVTSIYAPKGYLFSPACACHLQVDNSDQTPIPSSIEGVQGQSLGPTTHA